MKRLDYNEYLYMVMGLMIVFLMISDLTTYNTLAMSLLLFIVLLKNNWELSVPKLIYLLVLLIILVLLQIIIEPSPYFDINSSFKEIFRLCIYILIILIVNNIKVRETFFIKFWSFVFFITLTVSFLQYYNLFGINDLLGEFYWESIHLEVSTKYSSLDNFRAGSVFINFNNYAQFIVFFLAIVLSIKINKMINWKLFLLLFAAIFLSLVLAGSRTGFIVALLLIVLSIGSKIYIYGITKRAFTSLITTLPLLTILAIFVLIKFDLSNLRLFDIYSGLSNSLEYKYKTFLEMIDNGTILNFLIGFGPYNYTLMGSTQTDFDLGYILLFYGITGLLFYIFMIYFFSTDNLNEFSINKILNNFLIVTFVLTSLTSGLFLNLRVYSILILLLYTKIIPKNGIENLKSI